MVLCRNEADNLPRCLEALRPCAEIVVLDDGSTDGSREVAESCGARVVPHPFTSFADQRNWAMEHAGLASDWVLHLDADEVMTPEAFAEIAELLPRLHPRQVGFISRKVMLGNQWLRYSADYPVHVPRLVHRQGPRFVMRGHGETVEAPSPDRWFLAEPMLHYTFSKGWADWRERHERYARAEARRIREGLPPFRARALFGRDPAVRRAAQRSLSYRLPGRPILRFFYLIILRRGLLDGRAGLRFARAMASYERMISRALAEGPP